MDARYLYNFKFAGIVALSTLAACSSDVTGTNKQPVRLSFTTNVTGAAATGIRVSPDLSVGAAGDLILTKVQVVIGKIELNENDATNCVAEIEATGDAHAHVGQECEDVSRDPVLVDIPVDAAVHSVINVPLAQGTYTKLEAKLEAARDNATAFNTANPNLVGKSVRVEGTFKGTPFVFTSAVSAGLEMEFNPPLVIDATTMNATVTLDVAKWFLDGSGTVIDPNTATAGTSALQTIEDNIRRSFHAFEDNDESGVDDNTEHHG
ncbi:MAG TPA: hypothetical protein VF850_04920 [Gemmatimonadaceae bacterium]